MKKFGVLLLVAAMAISVVASMAGCGSSQNKEDAKAYMLAGDAKYAEGVKAYEELQAAQTSAVTGAMGGDTSGMDAVIAQMTQIANTMKADMAAAKVEYEKILPLDGVEDYVTYANVQIDIIGMYNDLLDAAAKLLASIQTTIMSGGTLDVMALMQSPEMTNITAISDEIAKLEKENKNFKSEKKLAE